MRKFSQLGLLITLFFMVSTAQAGLLIEPLIGYNINGKLSDDTPGSEDTKGGKGTAFGGRLGYQNFGLQLGVDYLNSTLKYDDTEGDYDLSEFGVFVGYKFPLLFRVYAGYIFSAEADASAGGKLTDGSGTKLGASFTGLPFVNLNLEYRTGAFDKITVNDVSTDLKTDYSALLLSISLPLNL